MIHSLAGGKLQNVVNFSGAKVKVNKYEKNYWFINPFSNLKIGDNVLVPVGNEILLGEVIKIEDNISSQISPVPYKKMKEILNIIKE